MWYDHEELEREESRERGRLQGRLLFARFLLFVVAIAIGFLLWSSRN